MATHEDDALMSGLNDILNDGGAAPAEAPAAPAAPAPAPAAQVAPAEAPAAPVAPVAPAVPAAPAAPAAAPVSEDLVEPPKDVLKEAPKAEVKKPEEAELFPEEVERGGEKAKNAWTKTKGELKELRRSLEAAQAALKEKDAALQKAAAVPPEEYEMLKKSHQELEARIGQLDLAQHPAFKKQYNGPMDQIYSRAVGVLVQAGQTKEQAVETAKQLFRPGANLQTVQDVLMNEPPVIQGALFNMVNDFTEIATRRQAALEDWKNSRAAVIEEDGRQQAVAVNEQFAKFAETAVSTLEKEGSWLYNRSADDENWNKVRDARVSAAMGILKTGTPEQLTRYIMDGVASPVYRKLYENERAKVRRMEEEMGQQDRSRPRIGNGAEAPKAPEPKSLDPDAYLKEMFTRK